MSHAQQLVLLNSREVSLRTGAGAARAAALASRDTISPMASAPPRSPAADPPCPAALPAQGSSKANVVKRWRSCSSDGSGSFTRRKLVERQIALPFLEIRADGEMERRALRREEVLGVAREVIPATPDDRQEHHHHHAASRGMPSELRPETTQAQAQDQAQDQDHNQHGKGQAAGSTDPAGQQSADSGNSKDASSGDSTTPTGVTGGSTTSDNFSSASLSSNDTHLTERQRHHVMHFHRRLQLLRFKGTVQLRDVRILDPMFVQSRDPEIRVRRHAIVINLTVLRALVLYDRCLVLIEDEDGDDAIELLLDNLQNWNEEGDSLPFPLRMLEAIFETSCAILHQSVASLDPFVYDTVESIMRHTSGTSILELQQCKSSVAKMLARLQALQQAFNEVLQSDRDMALMRLERIHDFPHLYRDENEKAWSLDHEEIELLLENYSQQLDTSVWQLYDLRDDLTEAMNAAALRLDSARNSLLTFELLVACISGAAGIGALIAGLFGMNLDSGVENQTGWFWGWFGAVIASVPLFVGLMFFIINRRGLLVS